MKLAPSPTLALLIALEKAQTQAAFAMICGVSQAAVSKWVTSQKWLPPKYVLRVEAATGVSRHDLRPDIYPREVSETYTSLSAGVDQRAAFRRGMIDGRPLSVAFNGRGETKGAAA